MSVPGYRLGARRMARIRELAQAVIDAKHSTSGDRYNWDGEGRRLRRNVEGYMAEVAVSHHFDVPFSWEVYSGRGDENHDVLVDDCWLIGVKASARSRPRLLVKCVELSKPVVPDLYILCRVSVEKGEVYLLGGATYERVLAAPKKRARPDGPLNRILTIDELFQIERRRRDRATT